MSLSRDTFIHFVEDIPDLLHCLEGADAAKLLFGEAVTSEILGLRAELPISSIFRSRIGRLRYFKAFNDDYPYFFINYIVMQSNIMLPLGVIGAIEDIPPSRTS